MIREDNAQLYTVEGIAASILMLIVVIFVVKGAPLTSNTASSSHLNVESQLETMGQDILTVLDCVPEGSLNSPLKQSIVDWNGVQYNGQANVRQPAVNFTANALKEALGDAGIAYNLEVRYYTPPGYSTNEILWNGKPSDNAVIVSRELVLHDDEVPDGTYINSTIPNVDGNATRFYNTVMVRLTLWRM
jgi:hypothetical protein